MNKYAFLITLIAIVLTFWIVTTEFLIGLIYLERSLTVLLVLNLGYVMHNYTKKK